MVNPFIIAISLWFGGLLRDGMNKFTLLGAAVLVIPQGLLKTREFKKHFWAKMTARIHQLIRGMWGRFCDTFVLDNPKNTKRHY